MPFDDLLVRSTLSIYNEIWKRKAPLRLAFNISSRWTIRSHNMFETLANVVTMNLKEPSLVVGPLNSVTKLPKSVA